MSRDVYRPPTFLTDPKLIIKLSQIRQLIKVGLMEISRAYQNENI